MEKKYVKYAVTSYQGWGWGNTPFEAFFKNPHTLAYSSGNTMKFKDHHFKLFEITCHEPEDGDNWQIWFQHSDGWVSSHRDDVTCTFVCQDAFSPSKQYENRFVKHKVSDNYLKRRNRLSGGNLAVSVN